MKTILTVGLIWLVLAFLTALFWHRLRKHGKRIEDEMDKWMRRGD